MSGHHLADALHDLAARIRAGGGPCGVCADRGLWRVVEDPPEWSPISPTLRGLLPPPPPDHCPGCGRETGIIRVVYRGMTGPGGIDYRKNGEDEDD